jgi:type VI secretion system secreted protein Hcp
MFKDRRTAMVGILVALLFLLSLTLTNPGKVLAVDAFLKIQGIEGEAQDQKHKAEIDVISWSFGETNSGTARTGGAGAGKVNMQNFKFTMRTNKASPKLFQACASGEHLQSAVLSVRRPGKDTSDFLQIWLSEVLVSSFVNMGSSGGTDPMEEIMLNFSKIKVSYKPMKADGSLEGSVEAGWDVPANRKF